MPERKMHYIGPGSESDPRTLSVSEDEADRLAKTGLWAAKKPTAKKEKEVKDG